MNNNKNNNNNKNKKVRQPTYKRALRVGCINVRGIVSNTDKRVELNHWIESHDLDVVCLQEWYVPHEKHSKQKKNNKNNNNNNNDNSNDLDSLSSNSNNQFEGEKENDEKHLDVSLEMAPFPKYEKLEDSKNTKTMILYKTGLDVLEFSHLHDIPQQGLDVSWLGVRTNRGAAVIGSVYHSPSFSCEYNDITYHMNIIKKDLKSYKNITFIINGDFNAKNETWGSTITDERGTNLNDWNAVSNLTCINDGTYTHIRGKKREVLDVTLISDTDVNLVNEWFVRDVPTARRDKNGKILRFSDHRGLITILNCDPILYHPPDRITWNLDEKKIPAFCEALIPQMIKWRQAYDELGNDKKNVDLLVEYFQMLIVETARKIFGFKKYNGESVNWVNYKMHKLLHKRKKIGNVISHLIGKMKKHYNEVRFAPRYLKNKLKRHKKRQNKIQKKLKKRKYQNIIESTSKIEKLLNNPNVNKEKLFYNTVDKIANRRTKKIPPIRDPDQNDKILGETDSEIADAIHKYYVAPLERNKYNDDHRLFHQYMDNVVENYKPNHNQPNSIVNRKFTKQEVLHVLNHINVQSAMAFDFIHYQLLVWAKFIILTNITLLFNMVYCIHQIVPTIWKRSEYIPVPKPGRIPYYCKNIRPISILPGMGRIIGKLHCNRLLTDCIKRKLISPNNVAFQCNRGSDDVFNRLTESIYQSFQNGHFLELAFMDLKSAYDSVNINALIFRLIKHYGYDGNIIAWYLKFTKIDIHELSIMVFTLDGANQFQIFYKVKQIVHYYLF